MTTQWQPQVSLNHVITVASADAPAALKKAANYVCDGTDDQETIEAAIAALGSTSTTVYNTTNNAEVSATSSGGTVQLTDGTYNISAPIDVTGKLCVVLKGAGAATVINNQQTDGGHAIVCSTDSPTTTKHWRMEVRDLMIQGSASSGYGLYWKNGSCQRVSNVHFVHNGTGGMYLGATEGAGQGNKIISDCQFLRNTGYGLHLDGVHETLITSCHFEENGDSGIYGVSAVDFHLANCSIEDHYAAGATYGLELTGTSIAPSITNTIVEDDVYISCNDTCEIAGCYFQDTTIIGVTVPKLTISSTVMGDTTLTDIGRCAITGCVFSLGSSSVDKLEVTGCRVWYGGTITIGTAIEITGCTMEFESSSTIEADASSVMMSFCGNAWVHNNSSGLTLDGNGKSSVRVTHVGNTHRWGVVTFEDVTYLNVSGNNFNGTGSLTFANCDSLVTFTTNTVSSTTIGILDTCAGTFNVQCNTILNSNMTDSGTGSTTNANNVVVSGSGWNP